MALKDPLFSTSSNDDEPSRSWWLHPALLVAALLVVAGVLAFITGERPARDRPPEEVEIEFEVNYDSPDAFEQNMDVSDMGS